MIAIYYAQSEMIRRGPGFLYKEVMDASGVYHTYIIKHGRVYKEVEVPKWNMLIGLYFKKEYVESTEEVLDDSRLT